MIENIVLDCFGFYHMGNWGNMSWWGFPFFGLWIIGFLITIVVIFYFIIHSEKSEEVEIINNAQKILDKRYAKGEMTRNEYIQANEDINNLKSK